MKRAADSLRPDEPTTLGFVRVARRAAGAGGVAGRRAGALVLAASLSFVIACEAPVRTTEAYEALPPLSIGVALPFDRTSTPGAAGTLQDLWTDCLTRRGWQVESPRSADAVLRSTIEVWNWQAGSDTAWVTVEARLERRPDGVLLWSDTGRGAASDRSDDDEDESPGIADSLFDWMFEEAWEGLVARPLSLSTREEDLRRAASQSVSRALNSLPEAPGRQ